MHGLDELYELKEMLCRELEEYGTKGKLSAGTLDVVDKLAHAAKNVAKIIEKCEEAEGENGYSSRGRSYVRNRSYARNNYSRNNDLVLELRDLMADTRDEYTRKELERFIEKLKG